MATSTLSIDTCLNNGGDTMCTNYRPSSRDLVREMMQLGELPEELVWKAETWKDYPAPIVRRGGAGRELLLATFGMVPRKRIPKGVKVFDAMNARFETVGEKRSFSGAWKRSQYCLIPMTAFYEPCYESGKAVRWGIGMSDERILHPFESKRHAIGEDLI